MDDRWRCTGAVGLSIVDIQNMHCLIDIMEESASSICSICGNMHHRRMHDLRCSMVLNQVVLSIAKNSRIECFTL